MNENPQVDSNNVEQKLWNPAAAVNWSVFLFTPIFGAWILSKNWSSLGENAQAKKARYWAFGGIIILFLSMLYIPYLIAWYFLSARPQMKYLKENIGTNYTKKAWKKPIKIAVVPWVLLLIFFAVQSSDEDSSDYSTDFAANYETYGETEEPSEIIKRIDSEYSRRTFTILQIFPYGDKALVYLADDVYILYSNSLDDFVNDQKITVSVKRGDNESYETANGSMNTVRTYIEVLDSELELYREAKKKVEKEAKEEQQRKEAEARSLRLALISENMTITPFSSDIFLFSKKSIAATSEKPMRGELEKQSEYDARFEQWKKTYEENIIKACTSVGVEKGKPFYMKVPADFMRTHLRDDKLFFAKELKYDANSEELTVKCHTSYMSIARMVREENRRLPFPINFRGTKLPDNEIYVNDYHLNFTFPVPIDQARDLKSLMGSESITDVDAFNSNFEISELILELVIDPKITAYGSLAVHSSKELRAVIFRDK